MIRTLEYVISRGLPGLKSNIGQPRVIPPKRLAFQTGYCNNPYSGISGNEAGT